MITYCMFLNRKYKMNKQLRYQLDDGYEIYRTVPFFNNPEIVLYMGKVATCNSIRFSVEEAEDFYEKLGKLLNKGK